MTDLPKTVTVTGIPYTVKPPNFDGDYGVDSQTQVIYVCEDAAPARRRQYLIQNVALLLMEAGGITKKTYQRYHRQVGAVLDRFLKDNTLDWVKESKQAPGTIWINGLAYRVSRDADRELSARNLGGEVDFNTLEIRILNNLEPDIMTYVTIHECTHAIFFEAYAGNLHDREEIVEAVAWQLYYFLRDNDLKILKPEGA